MRQKSGPPKPPAETVVKDIAPGLIASLWRRDRSALIAIMSPDAEASEWVEREVQLALSDQIPIFPLLLRGKGFALLITRQYIKVDDGTMPPPDFY